jgi:stage II sporulation protein AB (anti-sigma F factor)
MRPTNQVKLEFESRSANEGFARSAAACFAAQLDPTLEELGDLKTAVSEAVTNVIVHAYPDRIGPVSLRLRRLAGNVLEITVKDRGCGIPKKDAARVFDRFYKSDQSRGKDKKGTGLGLSITREIIKAHGENINVISTEGVGTEFVFSLPLGSEE